MANPVLNARHDLMVLCRDGILDEADYCEWRNEDALRTRIGSLLEQLATGPFTEINSLVSRLLNEHRAGER